MSEKNLIPLFKRGKQLTHPIIDHYLSGLGS
jgi:hypothetical protein